MTWWIAPLFSAIGSSQQKKPPKFTRTAEEEKVLTDLKAKAEGGFNVQERVQQTIRPALDIRDQAKSQTLGSAYQKGMQNSIITDELMRKIDRDTQEKVLDMSDKIAQQNQQYKDSYESKVQQFQMDTASQTRQADEARRQFSNQRTASNWSNIGAFIQGGMQNDWDWEKKAGGNKTGIYDMTGTWDKDNPPLTNIDDYLLWVQHGIRSTKVGSKENNELQDILESLK